MISKRISDDIPPQMKILNIVISNGKNSLKNRFCSSSVFFLDQPFSV